MSNVIKFPKSNKNELPSLDEVKENIEIQKVNQIAEVSGVVADTAIETLMQCGYDFPIGTRAEKDFCLMVEAIRSMVMRYHDEHHTLQEFSDNCFEIDHVDESFVFIPPNIRIIKESEDE